MQAGITEYSVDGKSPKEEKRGFESRFMRGCFSSPEVVEEEVSDSGSSSRWNEYPWYRLWFVEMARIVDLRILWCVDEDILKNYFGPVVIDLVTVFAAILFLVLTYFSALKWGGISSPLHKAGRHLNTFKIHGKFCERGNALLKQRRFYVLYVALCISKSSVTGCPWQPVDAMSSFF